MITYRTIDLARVVEKNTLHFDFLDLKSSALIWRSSQSRNGLEREREAASVSGMWFFTIARLPHNAMSLWCQATDNLDAIISNCPQNLISQFQTPYSFWSPKSRELRIGKGCIAGYNLREPESRSKHLRLPQKCAGHHDERSKRKTSRSVSFSLFLPKSSVGEERHGDNVFSLGPCNSWNNAQMPSVLFFLDMQC